MPGMWSELYDVGLLLSLTAAVWATDCVTETGVCYQGSNLAITLDQNSVAEGCQEVGGAVDCCDLCAQYWPQCLSWQFIQEGNAAAGYAGMAFYCCLKGSFRPDPVDAAYCSSGYFNPSCTLTAACSFEMTGTGFNENSSIVALDASSNACGSGTVAEAWPGITNPQVATSAVDPTAVFDLGTASGGSPGDFKLCYSSADSDDVTEYTTEVGNFTMKGPTSGQSFTCTLGSDCTLVLAGHSQSATGAAYKVLVIEGSTCGAGAVAASFTGTFENPRIVWDNEDDNYYEMKIARTGDTTATYSLCWASSPATVDDYVFLVGSFVMTGPTFGMTHVCTMGKACAVSLQGQGLAQTNAVLASVGTYDATFGSICRALDDSLVASFGTSFVHPVRADQSSPFADYAFGTPLGAHNNQPGSGYRLCWARAPTQTPPAKTNADYLIDAGLFTLHGPVQSNHNCVLTSSCSITLTGSGFDLGAHGLLILESGASCTDSSALLANASQQTWANPAAAATDTFSFGIAAEGIPSTSYVLCWAFQPTTQADYNVYVGTFQLGGPDLLSGSVCIKGEECILTLTGVAFASTNKLLVIAPGSTCGSGAVPATFSPMEVEKLVQDGTFTEYRLGRPNTGTAQAGYTLCWSDSPSITSDFMFTLGDFTVTGPNVQDVACTFGLSCVVSIIGLDLASTNKIIVLSAGNCGDNAPTLASITGMLSTIGVETQSPYVSYDLNTPLSGQPRSDYTLCWSHSPGDGAASLYKAPIGYLTVNGPVQVAQHCILGTDCDITLSGVGLVATNQLLIIDADSSCGDSSPTIAVFDGLTNPASPETGNPSLYKLGIARTTSDGPGSGYTICWGHNPSSNENFNIQLGTFSIDGPDRETSLLYCTLGWSCSIQVTGVNLAATSKITITTLSDVCGQANLNLVYFDDALNPVNASGNDFDTFDLGIPTGGYPGDYKVCWGYAPTQESDYHVPVATLRMGGPVPQDNECTLSEPCKITVAGVRLGHASRLLFISQNSRCGDASPTVITWSGINNPASTDLMVPPANPGYVYSDGDRYDGGLGFSGEPGFYRICWGFDPFNGYPDYKVTLGNFVMNGPVQGMDIACTLGKACVIEPTGVGLNATNQIEVVSNAGLCGSTEAVVATIPGLSSPAYVTDGSYALGSAVQGGSYALCRVPTPAESCIGTHYRICWSHGVHAGGANFVVELGIFSLSGPYGTYRVDCSMGSVCSFILYGSRFTLTNRILLIEQSGSCGDSTPLVASFAGLMNPGLFSKIAADGSSATIRLGQSHAGRPDTYRICWGVDPVTASDYKVDVGFFYFHEVPDGCTPGVFSYTCSSPR